MMQSAAGNAAKLEESEARIQKKVKQIDFDVLERTGDADTQGVCSLTLQSYIDALRDGDCMCLTLDVSRPEAAIAGGYQACRV